MPQWAITHCGSAARTASNDLTAAENQKECSRATPRSKAPCTSALHDVGKCTAPRRSPGCPCACTGASCRAAAGGPVAATTQMTNIVTTGLNVMTLPFSLATWHGRSDRPRKRRSAQSRQRWLRRPARRTTQTALVEGRERHRVGQIVPKDGLVTQFDVELWPSDDRGHMSSASGRTLITRTLDRRSFVKSAAAVAALVPGLTQGDTRQAPASAGRPFCVCRYLQYSSSWHATSKARCRRRKWPRHPRVSRRSRDGRADAGGRRRSPHEPDRPGRRRGRHASLLGQCDRRG